MSPLSQPLTLIAALALGCLASLPSIAQEAPPTSVVIVDGSGSMWGNLGTEKQSKLEAVREALRTLLPSLRPEARVGLASFGHRRRGSCGDAEVIMPPDVGATERLAPPIDKLNAVGKGPLVLALREAANAIAGATPASVILIADDLDNCGQDICTALNSILAASPNLVVHTVALAFDKPKIAHISCIARMTGGKLWDARDTVGLNSAIAQALSLAHVQNTPAAETAARDEAPAEKQAAAGAPPGLYLSVGLGPTSATLDTPVRWRIAKSGDTDTDTPLRDTRAAALYEKLEPGRYDVEATLGLASAKQTVDVPADTATEARLDLYAGVLKMQARQANDAPLLSTPVFTVTPAAADVSAPPLWVGRDAQPEIVLPAGEYIVSVQSGSARQSSKVTITPATGTTFNQVMGAGTLELSAARGNGATAEDRFTGDVTFILYQDDPDQPQGRREIVRSAAPNPTFTLSAGTYYITARTPASEVREQIAIGAGDIVKRTLPLSLAHIKLASTLGNQPTTSDNPVTYRVVRLGAEPREVARTSSKEPEFDLSAGRYRIEASLGAGNVMAATEINLAAGQGQKITLPLQGGSVTLKRADAPGLGNDAFWEVRDDSQRVVLRSSQPQPTAILSPGRYVVSVETASAPLRNVIEVKANEHRTFDISAQ
jgi:Ca-activated chloride channel family protein